MQGINSITGLCTYSTPCGWCAKWDKKCDKKIGYMSKPQSEEFNDGGVNCNMCSKYGWHMPECAECNKSNGFKYFERKKDD